MNRLVILGAGMVGRGLLGELFGTAGWDVRFFDIDETVVTLLNTAHGYTHFAVATGGTRETWVPVAGAGLVTDVDAVVAALVEADLAATAVGAAALPKLAPVLAAAVRAREAARVGPLDLLLCENLPDADAVMAGYLERDLETPAAGRIGLVTTSIGRMIPSSRPDDPPGTVRAEPYGYLPIDARARLGRATLPGRVIVDHSVPFTFYEHRKYYIHNLGHCFTAYLGMAAGDELVDQAISRPEIRYVVRAAMTESAVALASRYGTGMGELLTHVDDLLYRFGNRALGDPVTRVGRDPVRKLAPADRFLGSLTMAAAAGLSAPYLCLAVATGALQLRRLGWDETAVWECLGAAGADVIAPRRDLVAAQMSGLTSGFDLDGQLDLIERHLAHTW
ncbi:MAG: hypothetical protein LBI33_03410 [Propionibacteriaceae bacterium]|nr:hypothetical protein [Propionibacteriaceae bacterium]